MNSIKTDDKMRSNTGVVASLHLVDMHTIRIVFDDVSGNIPEYPVDWKTTSLFTFQDFSKEEITSLKLSKDDFARIGENLVIRLLALNNELRAE